MLLHPGDTKTNNRRSNVPRITLAPSRPRWLTSTVVLQEVLETFKNPVDDGFIGITPLHGNELSVLE
ncbi:unnamed protein product, partial [Clonostachys chloroleuca]